jgi:hypothetical protein
LQEATGACRQQQYSLCLFCAFLQKHTVVALSCWQQQL